MWIKALLYSSGVLVAYLAFLLVQVQQLDQSHFLDKPSSWPPAGVTYATLARPDMSLSFARAGPSKATKCITFLHGFPESAASWSSYMQHYAKQGWHVTAPDQRYINGSQPHTHSPLTLDVLVADIAALLQSAPCNKSVLVGHDWGAAVAWSTAIAHPELLSSLMTFNVPHMEIYRMHNLVGMPMALQQAWYFLFFGMARPAALWKVRQADYSWFTWFTFGSSFKGTYSTGQIEAYKRMYDKSMYGMLEWYVMGNSWLLNGLLPWTKGIMGSVWNDGTSPVKVATLQMYGDHDMYVNPAMAHKSLSSAAVSHPNKKLVMLDAGHWLPAERTRECIKEMDSFLKTL
eukprot:TRINITY_DN5486_c0_g1_i1.p1 TRINITY_DN5486_c0_g1~~TRINITY_DN5486_c0_g1_i1.p1  ORF type:complete len:345 (-),score=95.17 TRINITY_DN5486_c0_g1_i1:110-1144(-)